eukprot:gnl/TRDRNA2_/TRDRNA2_131452_c0_seq1.p1 gnl/TRDRNA2_/TRDRNA2_131452_c0~~gnl/TRDRNA2_/TRDRNA2_131452_c0_seq1.p1  ORF type:complete len:1000 (-),score=164.14 gnl/TRDRNA2_/TRDRNA2_131452_c0_seq1:106-2769(-)
MAVPVSNAQGASLSLLAAVEPVHPENMSLRQSLEVRFPRESRDVIGESASLDRRAQAHSSPPFNTVLATVFEEAQATSAAADAAGGLARETSRERPWHALDHSMPGEFFADSFWLLNRSRSQHNQGRSSVHAQLLEVATQTEPSDVSHNQLQRHPDVCSDAEVNATTADYSSQAWEAHTWHRNDGAWHCTWWRDHWSSGHWWNSSTWHECDSAGGPQGLDGNEPGESALMAAYLGTEAALASDGNTPAPEAPEEMCWVRDALEAGKTPPVQSQATPSNLAGDAESTAMNLSAGNVVSISEGSGASTCAGAAAGAVAASLRAHEACISEATSAPVEMQDNRQPRAGIGGEDVGSLVPSGQSVQLRPEAKVTAPLILPTVLCSTLQVPPPPSALCNPSTAPVMPSGIFTPGVVAEQLQRARTPLCTHAKAFLPAAPSTDPVAAAPLGAFAALLSMDAAGIQDKSETAISSTSTPMEACEQEKDATTTGRRRRARRGGRGKGSSTGQTPVSNDGDKEHMLQQRTVGISAELDDFEMQAIEPEKNKAAMTSTPASEQVKSSREPAVEPSPLPMHGPSPLACAQPALEPSPEMRSHSKRTRSKQSTANSSSLPASSVGVGLGTASECASVHDSSEAASSPFACLASPCSPRRSPLHLPRLLSGENGNESRKLQQSRECGSPQEPMRSATAERPKRAEGERSGTKPRASKTSGVLTPGPVDGVSRPARALLNKVLNSLQGKWQCAPRRRFEVTNSRDFGGFVCQMWSSGAHPHGAYHPVGRKELIRFDGGDIVLCLASGEATALAEFYLNTISEKHVTWTVSGYSDKRPELQQVWTRGWSDSPENSNGSDATPVLPNRRPVASEMRSQDMEAEEQQLGRRKRRSSQSTFTQRC